MNEYFIDISLRVKSSVVSSEEMKSHIPYTPWIVKEVDSFNKDRSGKVLNGTNSFNYFSCKISKLTNSNLINELSDITSKLVLCKDLFKRVRESNGKCEFFIGVYFNKFFGETIDFTLLELLSSLYLDLSLDLYNCSKKELLEIKQRSTSI